MRNHAYYVYIATNKTNSVLYTGVTNDLIRGMYELKQGFHSKFTSKYNVSKLVYFEVFDDITIAIAREKQIKAGSRKKKLLLITQTNREFQDLYQTIL